MNKTIKIEGMHCGHCEARIKKALESIDGVNEVNADSKSGTAQVVLSESVDNAVLTEAVEDLGFSVISII